MRTDSDDTDGGNPGGEQDHPQGVEHVLSSNTIATTRSITHNKGNTLPANTTSSLDVHEVRFNWSMFSSSIARRGRSVLAVTSSTKQSNPRGLGALSSTAQGSTSAPEGAVGMSSRPRACRRQEAAVGLAKIEFVEDVALFSVVVVPGSKSRLIPDEEVEFTVSSRSAHQRPRTSVFMMVHIPPRSNATGQLCGRRWQTETPILQLCRRRFSTQKEPTDSKPDDISDAKAHPSMKDGSEVAEGSPAPEAGAKKKSQKARISRKRRTKTTRSDNTAPPASAAVEEEPPATSATRTAGGSKTKKSPLVEIPEARKAAFEQARRAGVIRRAKEGGSVPQDGSRSTNSTNSKSSKSSNTTTSTGGNGSGDDGGSDGVASTFPWQGRSTGPPLTWTEPTSPLRPEGFLPGRGTDEGDANVEVGAEESGASSAGGKTTRRRSRRQRTKQEHLHPVLGHFVADLKYKRVYVTSVEALMKVRVWENARTLRPVHAMGIFRAKKMEAERMKTRKTEAGKVKAKGNTATMGMPGVITLYQRPLPPLRSGVQKYVFGIVDGQHRLGALLLLAEEGLWDPSERNVVVEVFDTQDEKNVQELFVDINKAEPIEFDLDQPGPEQVEKYAKDAVFHLYKKFRPMFGGKRIRRPSLHAATFREHLLKSGMIERHELYGPDILLDYLLRVNEMLSQRNMEQWETMIGPEEGKYGSREALIKALKKANSHKFWLGMEMSWTIV